MNKEQISLCIEQYKNEMIEKLGEFFDSFEMIKGGLDMLSEISQISISKSSVEKVVRWVTSELPMVLFGEGSIYTEETSDSVNLALDDVKRLSEIVSKISVTKENADNFKSISESSIKFLNKINNVELEKLTTAANLFEHIATLSESISGNFDGLAESLNDKIAPLMEELKTLMEELGRKVEQTAADISASTFAAANPNLSSSEQVAQAKRENPHMSNNDAAVLAQKRMVEQLRQQNNNVTSKLDELIDIFREGSARVRTV
jgi:hypothetical protein